MSSRRLRRGGATLIELLVSITILGIMGAAIVRLFVSQSRFVDQVTKQRAARTVSRVSINLMLSELRGIESSGGVVSASSGALTVRVPYAMGVSCGSAGGATALSLLPVDSADYSNAVFAGFAVRDGSGAYQYVETGSALSPSPASSLCLAAGITTLPRGQVIAVSPPITTPSEVGAAVLVFQRVTYAFLPSVVIPGRMGLWRSVTNGTREEVATPFDSSSVFRYFADGADSATVAPPANLADVRGVEFVFGGASEGARAGRTAPEVAMLRSAVFFLNRPEP